MKRRFKYAAAAVAGILVGRAVSRRLTARSLRGRVAVVTGGSRGLGLCLARELVRQGARVVLLARDAEELEQAARQLTAAGGDVLPLPCDVTHPDEVGKAVETVMDTYGRIDVLINNAGAIQVGPLEHMTRGDFASALDLHMLAPLSAALAVIPFMRAQGEGSIVNIASVGGLVAVPHMAPYSASKFALVGLSDALRAELAASNISVTTVCPGLMRTGSHLNAEFKGKMAAEFTGFAMANGLPIASMDADSAARAIIRACRRGTPRLDLTVPARLICVAQGVAPNTVARRHGMGGAHVAESYGRDINNIPLGPTNRRRSASSAAGLLRKSRQTQQRAPQGALSVAAEGDISAL